MFLQTLGIAAAVVAAAEIGDKTQLLAIFLAARFRQPKQIVLGILCATIFNHALAGALGASLAAFISPVVLKWTLIASFVAMAVWILIPDSIDEGGFDKHLGRWGVFGTTLVLFFLAEMGDKTQIGTIAMAAKFPGEALFVVMGSTLGILIADAPAVWLGDKISKKLSMSLMRKIAAAIFLLLAVLAYFS